MFIIYFNTCCQLHGLQSSVYYSCWPLGGSGGGVHQRHLARVPRLVGARKPPNGFRKRQCYIILPGSASSSGLRVIGGCAGCPWVLGCWGLLPLPRVHPRSSGPMGCGCPGSSVAPGEIWQPLCLRGFYVLWS